MKRPSWRLPFQIRVCHTHCSSEMWIVSFSPVSFSPREDRAPEKSLSWCGGCTCVKSLCNVLMSTALLGSSETMGLWHPHAHLQAYSLIRVIWCYWEWPEEVTLPFLFSFISWVCWLALLVSALQQCQPSIGAMLPVTAHRNWNIASTGWYRIVSDWSMPKGNYPSK